MLITRVKIKNYKNLKNIEFSFKESGGLAVFVGCNGCGKSNLLEAISLIAEDVGVPASFSQIPFAYELDYINSNGTEREFKRSLSSDEIGSSAEGAREISAVGLYNGEFARIKPKTCAEAKDLPAAILLYLYEKKHPFALSDDIVSKECAKFVSCAIEDNGEFDQSEGPQSEMEDLYVKLLRLSNDEGRIRLAYATFNEMVQGYTRGDPQRCEKFILVFFEIYEKYIRDFTIEFEKEGVQFSSFDLSEGEKKCLLLDYALRLGQSSDSIVLLDEPDASVHESKKLELLDALKKYAADGHSVFMSTHSPVIINECDASHLFALTRRGVDVSVETGEKVDVESELLGDRLSWFVNRPIVFFEGKSDVQYVRKAIEFFKTQPGYEGLNIESRLEFRILGGTGETDFIVDEIDKINNNRSVYVCLDNDGAGNEALHLLREKGFFIINAATDVPHTTSNRIAFVLPQKDSFKVRMIEDYFSHDVYKRIMGEVYDPTSDASMSEFKEKVSGLKKYVSKYALSKSCPNAQSIIKMEDFEGFHPLVDVIQALSEKSI